MAGEHLLLVDDDVDIIDLTKSILSDEGYLIDETYDGESAVEMVKPNKYSLVLLDFVLPGIKGDIVAEKIRSLDPELDIILFTGYKSSISEEILAKFKTVIEKPMHPNSLLSTIREAISMGGRRG
jgi:DNA-binding NtrC family response regulator